MNSADSISAMFHLVLNVIAYYHYFNTDRSTVKNFTSYIFTAFKFTKIFLQNSKTMLGVVNIGKVITKTKRTHMTQHS